MDYTHSPLNEEVEFVCGSYHIEEENRLVYEGKHVLYIIGQTSPISSCCGGHCSGLRFITVPGFIEAWQIKTNYLDFPVSEVEPVVEEKEKDEIRGILQREHNLSNINFW